MVGIEGYAHADAAINVPPAMAQRHVQARDHAAEDGVEVGQTAQAGEDDGELVAAHAGDHVGGAHRVAQPFRHGAQQGVAGIMAGAVVDPLEFVDVDQHDRHLAAGSFGRLGRLHQAGHEMGSVGEAGKGVGHRQMGKMAFGLLAVGDVDDAGKDALFAGEQDRAGAQQDIADNAFVIGEAAFVIVDAVAPRQPVEQAQRRGMVDDQRQSGDIVRGAQIACGGIVHAQDGAVVADDDQRQRHGHEQPFERFAIGGERDAGGLRILAGGPFHTLQPVGAGDRDPHAAMKHQHRHDHAGHGRR